METEDGTVNSGNAVLPAAAQTHDDRTNPYKQSGASGYGTNSAKKPGRINSQQQKRSEPKQSNMASNLPTAGAEGYGRPLTKH